MELSRAAHGTHFSSDSSKGVFSFTCHPDYQLHSSLETLNTVEHTCVDGKWEGDFIENYYKLGEKGEEACVPVCQPCENGGNCSEVTANQCYCPPGTFGRLCEDDSNQTCAEDVQTIPLENGYYEIG